MKGGARLYTAEFELQLRYADAHAFVRSLSWYIRVGKKTSCLGESLKRCGTWKPRVWLLKWCMELILVCI